MKCEGEVKGGCDVQCQDPKGAIFCDGSYVDSNGNLDKCAAALDAILNLKVDASAQCANGHCEAQASVSACSTTTPDSNRAPIAPVAVFLGAVAAAIARRGRRTER